jgi:hypothetical protein
LSGRRRSSQLLPRFSTSLRNMPCKGLHHVQSSRHCTGIRPKLRCAQASSSLPGSCCNHFLLPRSCTCLPRTLCMCLRLPPTSPRCRCSCSKLCSAHASSSPPGSCCSSHHQPLSCTCRRRTPCTRLHLPPTSPRCRCRCSTLCSAQARSTPPGSSCTSHLLPHCTCLRRMPCMRLHSSPTSQHCMCSSSNLYSAQASSSQPGSCCSCYLQPLACTFLTHKLCTFPHVALSSRRCTCKLTSHRCHRTLHMPGGCTPTRALQLSSPHCIHPHQHCSCRRMSRCQRPCRLRTLSYTSVGHHWCS